MRLHVSISRFHVTFGIKISKFNNQSKEFYNSFVFISNCWWRMNILQLKITWIRFLYFCNLLVGCSKWRRKHPRTPGSSGSPAAPPLLCCSWRARRCGFGRGCQYLKTDQYIKYQLPEVLMAVAAWDTLDCTTEVYALTGITIGIKHERRFWISLQFSNPTRTAQIWCLHYLLIL